MSLMGSLGLAGIVGGGTTGPPSSSGYSTYTGVVGDPGAPVAGTSTFTLGSLIGGSSLVTIALNNNTFTVGSDFTVNYGTGTITFLAYSFEDGDRIAFSYLSGV